MSSFLVFLCKSKFFPTCICPFTYVDISSTSLWHLSEEPFQSPLPTLDFLSWPSSYFFSFSREILYQHLQHNCQLTFVVMSVKCFWWGVACVCFPSGWSLFEHRTESHDPGVLSWDFSPNRRWSLCFSSLMCSVGMIFTSWSIYDN